MADYTSTGLYNFPALTSLALEGKDRRYTDAVSSWLTEAIQEGDLLNEQDPQYDHAAPGMAYCSGDQLPPADNDKIPQYLQQVQIDMCTKAMRAHISALTDLKPVAGWRSENPKYLFHAEILNRLVRTWWVTQFADVQLGDIVKYAWATGTGDCELQWDPTLPGGGDHVMLARDFRDTLPIRPGRHRDPQLWRGVVLRDVWTTSSLRDKYPMYAPLIQDAAGGVLATIRGWFFSNKPKMQTPADPLATLGQPRRSGPPRPGEAVLYRCFLDDRTRNSTARPIVMGDPGTMWSYVVQPGELLYPQKRLICRVNDNLVVYDGPSPYWHGKFPVGRLTLWSLPWFFLGLSQLRTLKPLQNAINDSIQAHRLGIRRWMEPASLMNKTAVGENFMKLFDIRKPAQKIPVTGIATRMEDIMKTIDGPNPQVIAQNFQMYMQLKQDFESLSGTANLQQLMQLRQMPGADTIEKYFEALTPEIRDEGRQIEVFLRAMSPQILYNTFQFMDSARRVHLLGDAGLAIEDFDFDPDQLVPAIPQSIPGPVDPVLGIPPQIPNPAYDPMFDSQLPRAQRAKSMAKLMVFIAAPNSLLAMHSAAEEMKDFQLARMGYLDFWSLMERMQRPNVGTPPPIPLPPLRQPTPEELLEGLQQGRFLINPAMAGGMAGGMMGGAIGGAGTGAGGPGQPPPNGESGGPPENVGEGGSPGPAQPAGTPGAPPAPVDPLMMLTQLLTVPGAILEIRVPVTITERLQAQRMLGIGMTENPAGRKASGGSPPKQEEKTDPNGGKRQTITESSGSRNA